MKKLIYLALLFSVFASATITDVQHPAGVSGTTTTCVVTIAANGTGATRLLIGKVAAGNGISLSSVSTGAGTWTVCGANCNATDTAGGETSLAWLNGPASSTTTITFTLSGSGNSVCWVEEYSTTTSGFTLETTSTANKKTDTTCTSCASATPTITGTSDVISAIAGCGGTCSGTITGWSTLYTSGDGSARQINTTTTAFNWTQTSSSMATATIAFKENSGAVTVFGIDKKQKLEKFWPQ